MAYIGKIPAAAPLTSSDVADDIITLAKMAGGTDGNVITYDASGNPAAVATGTDGQVLTSTGAGSPPAFEDAAGGANTPAFAAYMSADQSSIADNTWAKVVMNTEFFDSDGKYDNGTNYRFTPTVAGKYMFGANLYIDADATANNTQVSFYKNGTKVLYSELNSNNHYHANLTGVIDLDADDYVELYAKVDVSDNAVWNVNMDGTTTNNRCFWYGYKLIT